MKNLFHLFFSEDFGEKLEKELDHVLAEQDSAPDTIVQEIAEHYRVIISALSPKYQTVLINRDDSRQIYIDEKFYDLDCAISHNQVQLSEHLAAIDALFSDLSASGSNKADCIAQIEDVLNKA